MKNIIIVSFAYIAAVIGAGFASGAEVVSFFLAYGKESFIGLVLSGLLFFMLSYLMLDTCVKHKISSFDEYLKFIMPPFWKRFTDVVVFIFMIISLAAMSAAAGEIFLDAFGMPPLVGACLFSGGCVIILGMSLSKIADLSGALGIGIAVGIVTACLYIINFRFLESFENLGKVITSSVSYTAYNGVAAAVILCNMSRFLTDNKQALKTSAIIGAGLFVILLSLWCVVGIYYGKVKLGEIPMLFIAARQGRAFYVAYSIILFLAVFTTAISNGFGVMEYVKRKAGRKTAIFIVLISMIFLARAGFSGIVDVAYRGCGYASLILPIFIVINRVKERKEKKNEDIRE